MEVSNVTFEKWNNTFFLLEKKLGGFAALALDGVVWPVAYGGYCNANKHLIDVAV